MTSDSVGYVKMDCTQYRCFCSDFIRETTFVKWVNKCRHCKWVDFSKLDVIFIRFQKINSKSFANQKLVRKISFAYVGNWNLWRCHFHCQNSWQFPTARSLRRNLFRRHANLTQINLATTAYRRISRRMSDQIVPELTRAWYLRFSV